MFWIVLFSTSITSFESCIDLLIYRVCPYCVGLIEIIHRSILLNTVVFFRFNLLAEIFPFEISSGVPQLPMPFVIAEPEVIGGIILGISILYIAIRLGLLNIFCSVPIFPT